MYKIEFRSKEGKLIRKTIYETQEKFEIWKVRHQKKSWCRLTFFKHDGNDWVAIH